MTPTHPSGHPERHGSHRRAGFRAWLTLTAAGLVGVASLAPYVRDTLLALLPGPPPLPVPAIVALALLQSAVVTAALTALGVFAAPRVGFSSRVLRHFRGDAQRPWRPELRAALVAAVLVGLGMVAADFAFLGVLGEDLRAVWNAAPRTLALTLQGVLYGGVTEELWIRFGILSGLVWLVWRVLSHREDPPPPALVASVVVVTAVVFALGHLPALAAVTSVDAPWVARSLLLNGIPGIVFGYLFVRYSLEAAMLAHVGTHLVLSLLALVTVLP